jgi:hypothetical protein
MSTFTKCYSNDSNAKKSSIKGLAWIVGGITLAVALTSLNKGIDFITTGVLV